MHEVQQFCDGCHWSSYSYLTWKCETESIKQISPQQTLCSHLYITLDNTFTKWREPWCLLGNDSQASFILIELAVSLGEGGVHTLTIIILLSVWTLPVRISSQQNIHDLITMLCWFMLLRSCIMIKSHWKSARAFYYLWLYITVSTKIIDPLPSWLSHDSIS